MHRLRHRKKYTDNYSQARALQQENAIKYSTNSRVLSASCVRILINSIVPLEWRMRLVVGKECFWAYFDTSVCVFKVMVLRTTAAVLMHTHEKCKWILEWIHWHCYGYLCLHLNKWKLHWMVYSGSVHILRGFICTNCWKWMFARMHIRLLVGAGVGVLDQYLECNLKRFSLVYKFCIPFFSAEIVFPGLSMQISLILCNLYIF